MIKAGKTVSLRGGRSRRSNPQIKQSQVIKRIGSEYLGIARLDRCLSGQAASLAPYLPAGRLASRNDKTGLEIKI